VNSTNGFFGEWRIVPLSKKPILRARKIGLSNLFSKEAQQTRSPLETGI
jgi:hypothetical protein